MKIHISLLALILCSSALAQTPENRRGPSLIDAPQLDAPLNQSWEVAGAASIQSRSVPVAGQNFARALQLQVAPPADARTYDVEIRKRLSRAADKNDLIAIFVTMRSPQSVAVTLSGEITVAPNERFLSRSIKLTPEWKQYRFAAKAPRAFTAGSAKLNFRLGGARGTLEIGDLRIENLGKVATETFAETVDFWSGQPRPDTWRAPAMERIEKFRKGDFTVQVRDAAGNPVKGAQVKVTMTRHAFRWGNVISTNRLFGEDPDNQRYRAELKRLYNTAVFGLDMKWGVNEGRPGSLTDAGRGLDWLQANGFQVRGHALVWGGKTFLPGFVLGLSEADAKRAVEERVRAQSQRFRGRLYAWDVVNEAATETDLWDKIGWDEFANSYKLARQADPGAQLVYNDYNISNEAPDGGNQRKKVVARIETLIQKGAPLDVIGDQGHMGPLLTPIDRVLAIWDEMARYGKPLEITEFDVGVPDDQIHGEYVRDYLIAAFSHPSMQSFIMWGFWEGDHWRASSGAAMFRKDWSKRPAQIAYEDLVLNQWWTRAEGSTTSKGEYQTRGFLGDYEISVTKDGKTVTRPATLAPGGQIWRVNWK